MRAIFLGTPAAALPTLDALDAVADVVGVFTQPDRAQGRSKALIPTPVKLAAKDRGWPVFQPESRVDLNEHMATLPTIDVGVVVAYGMILDPFALAVPSRGMVNVHFSQLPRWRGAAPVERAILAGDTRTAVTLMVMDEGLDTGPTLDISVTPIEPHESAGMVTARLAVLGAELLTRSLPGWVSGKLEPVPQPALGVTYAQKVTTSEAAINPVGAAAEVLAKVRAFNPRPGAYALWRGERVKIWTARPATPEPTTRIPGELSFDGERLLLHTLSDPVELLTIQPPGKSVMSGQAWARGRHGGLGFLA